MPAFVMLRASNVARASGVMVSAGGRHSVPGFLRGYWQKHCKLHGSPRNADSKEFGASNRLWRTGNYHLTTTPWGEYRCARFVSARTPRAAHPCSARPPIALKGQLSCHCNYNTACRCFRAASTVLMSPPSQVNCIPEHYSS